jgi:hypothetical protein
MPEGAHPLEDDLLPRGRGWAGIPFVEIDGVNWPLEFAARMLDIPVRDLADLVRITGLAPAGVIKIASYRRQGRQPRAFEAAKLIHLTEGIRKLSEELTALGIPPHGVRGNQVILIPVEDDARRAIFPVIRNQLDHLPGAVCPPGQSRVTLERFQQPPRSLFVIFFPDLADSI